MIATNIEEQTTAARAKDTEKDKTSITEKPRTTAAADTAHSQSALECQEVIGELNGFIFVTAS